MRTLVPYYAVVKKFKSMVLKEAAVCRRARAAGRGVVETASPSGKPRLFFAFPATAARCSQFATAGEGRYLFPAAALLNDSLRVPDVMSG